MRTKPTDAATPATSTSKGAPVEQSRDGDGGDLEHIRDTGLPPGIEVDEAKDPGAYAPRKPVLNRS